VGVAFLYLGRFLPALWFFLLNEMTSSSSVLFEKKNDLMELKKAATFSSHDKIAPL
jgi:hypothetical protein